MVKSSEKITHNYYSKFAIIMSMEHMPETGESKRLEIKDMDIADFQKWFDKLDMKLGHEKGTLGAACQSELSDAKNALNEYYDSAKSPEKKEALIVKAEALKKALEKDLDEWIESMKDAVTF
jgi:hypothetical protein